MKKTIIFIVSIAIFLFIVFGLLYGWFRSKVYLTQDELNQLNSISKKPDVPVENAKEILEKLWLDHVALTRMFILSIFSDKSTDAIEQNLMKNQEDIGNEINKYYPGSGQIITQTLKEHIQQAKSILEDLKYKRFSRLFSDINAWYNNADKFSMILQSINPAWKISDHMAEHLRITEREAVYQWLGLHKASKIIYDNRIVPNANKIANQLSTNI